MDKSSKTHRHIFLDNLRTFAIFLVIVYHSGWVYERSGFLSSIWIVDDPFKNNLAGIVNIILDIFVMPTIFFISGYLTSLSLKTKKRWDYLKCRFNRLMLPWILAVLILIPLYKVIFLYSRDLAPQNLMRYFHLNGEIIMNQGWLWFLPVLFLFDLIYCILSKSHPIPLKINLKQAVFAIFLLGVMNSFCFGFFNHSGWIKTILLDFQKERLFIYFLVFLLGSFCFHNNIFSKERGSRKCYYLINFTLWIPINVYMLFLLNLIFNPGKFIISHVADTLLLWSSFHLSLLGMLYILINTFRFYLNRKITIIDWLNKCSYGTYIIHFIVMGAIAVVLSNAPLSSLAKYGMLIVSTYMVSNLIIFLYIETGRRGCQNLVGFSVNNGTHSLIKP
jgi:hypothetical protein